MRPLIAFATLVGIFGIVAFDAGAQSKKDIPKFIQTLEGSTNAKARAQAANDLGHCGAIRASDAKDAIGPLIKALKNDKDTDVRRASAKALGDIGSYSDKCVDALTDALKDTSPVVRIAAATALGQYGPEAKSALPLLRELVARKDNKDDKKVSQFAAAAAKAIVGIEKKKK